MRLIDADELNELMTAEWFLDSLAANEDPREIKNKLENAIDSVPLAYDVEKVVAELENQRIEVQKMRNDCIALSDAEVCDIENATYGRTINIVRKGCMK